MSLATLKVGAISCLAVGVGLGIFSAFIPGMEQDNLDQTSKTESQLTATNQAKWDSVPGQYNYNVEWNHYLYPNENFIEVMSQGSHIFLDPIQQRRSHLLHERPLRLPGAGHLSELNLRCRLSRFDPDPKHYLRQ